MSILSFAIMPRAKFFQTMTFNVIGVCIGAAIALLTIFCAVQARINTTPVSTVTSGGPGPGTAVSQYNSSASAVCAIWLFVNICFANALRFSRPQLQFPVIIYSIFANVSCTYAPEFATMTQGIAFVKELLEAFLSGFGIAAGVNLFIFPQSSRDVLFMGAAGYVKALQGVLKAQNGYLQSLESKEMFQPSNGQTPETRSPEVAAASVLKGALAGLTALHGKLQGDLVFAKREVVFSKLDAKDLDCLFKHLREIFLPLLGMGSVVDVFDQIATIRGWKVAESDEGIDSGQKNAEQVRKDKDRAQWNEIMRTLHEPFETMSTAMVDGLQHASYALELAKVPKSKSPRADEDLEIGVDNVEPGDSCFGEYLASKLASFYKEREVTLKAWCGQKGIKLGDLMATSDATIIDERTDDHSRNHRQLYLILYVCNHDISSI